MRALLMGWSLCVFVVLFACSTSLAGLGRFEESAPRVEYTISLPRPQTQTVDLSVRLRDVRADEVELVLPTWRPGRYVINEHAGEVRWYRAQAEDGSVLPIQKTSKNTWLVETGGANEVIVEYQMYANQLGIRTMHVDDSHAFLDGSAVFMHWPERRWEPALVRVDAPEDWRISTGLERASGVAGDVFEAPDYDILVDSPFEIGLHDLLEFEVDGVPHEIVVWQAPDEYDREGWIEDFAAIVEAQAEIFGGLPYERYVFQIHATKRARGATEHFNSTIIQYPPDIFHDDDRYLGFLGIVSHEMFHTWNVKRFRPAGIKPYDYTNENYTQLLWVAEGTTSYYDDLTLARAGIMEVDKYLERLGNSIEQIRDLPGAKVQSLAASSFDAWIKFNKPSADRVNTTVSFYSKGALVSLLLDLLIRTETGNESSLDDVVADLFEEFPHKGPGFTPEDFQRIAEARAGVSLDWFFEAYVRGVAPLDFEPYLGVVGLELVEEEDDDASSDDDDEETDEEEAYLGIDTNAQNGFPVVRSVRADGPAWEAGVIAGDTLLALNGRRLHDSLSDAVDRLEPGDDVTLTLSRDDMIREITMLAAPVPGPDLELRRLEDATEAQRAAFESWLDQPWEEDETEAEEAVAEVLDDLHELAAGGDPDAYFALFADDAMFLGTDATERWSIEEFRAFAEPHFADGHGWTYTVEDRWVHVSGDGDTAWFDEILHNERLGECRGSGVLTRSGDDWLIAQYNLTLPVPNELIDDVVKQIREGEGR